MNSRISRTATAMVVASAAALGTVAFAQTAAKCRPDSNRGPVYCVVQPNGQTNHCNCCYAGGATWVCCDNIPCQQCVVVP